jgi:hypothetical protein
MEYLVGVCLALAISGFSTIVGFDRSRAFYPTLLMVIASYYGLFAVMGGSVHALVIECAVVAAFVAASVLGFKFSLWIVVAGLAAHGLFDFIHAHLIHNPGMPAWWPMFCGAYDVTAAAYLAWLLRSKLARSAAAGDQAGVETALDAACGAGGGDPTR